jgi:hypothetical protein
MLFYMDFLTQTQTNKKWKLNRQKKEFSSGARFNFLKVRAEIIDE